MHYVVLLLALADIQPGNWEITAITELQGIREPAQIVQTRCLSEAEARDPSQLFGRSPGSNCRFTERNDTGSVFTFRLVCEGQATLSGAGTVRYSGTSLEGDLELKSDSFSARSRISGRRLGACQ